MSSDWDFVKGIQLFCRQRATPDEEAVDWRDGDPMIWLWPSLKRSREGSQYGHVVCMVWFYCIDSNIKKQNLFCSALVCLPETSPANMVKSNSKGYGSNERLMPVGADSACGVEYKKSKASGPKGPGFVPPQKERLKAKGLC
jgi:hypothetical protein